jgi:Fe-S cluster assembly protein SufD
MSAFVESLARIREQPAERRTARVGSSPLTARLQQLAQDGRTAFDEQGLPTRRSERWKGTSLAALERLDLARIGPASAESTVDLQGRTGPGIAQESDLVLLDGRALGGTTEPVSLGEGVRVLSLAEAAGEVPELLAQHLGALGDAKQDGFTGLHDACFEDVAVVVIAPGARVTRAIRVSCIATADASDRPSACFPRVLVVAGEASEADLLIESIALGDGSGFTSLLTEVHLAAGARLGLVELTGESVQQVHLSQTHARLERDARLETHVLSTSPGFVRSEVTVSLHAPGASVKMDGLYLGREESHHDHFTTVDHAAPHCTSDEEYRGVLSDRSSGVFRGRVVVRPDAQKTNARQSNPNLLLSERASIDTKPQLEIYADDVKASHGSTIGQLDAEALFFLRARGIDASEARRLLTRGFALALIDGIGDEGLRAHVDQRVDAALTRLDPKRLDEGSA